LNPPDGYISLTLNSGTFLYAMLFRIAAYYKGGGYNLTTVPINHQQFEVRETPEQIHSLIEAEKKRHRQYLKDVKEETL
jgi:hypothetical protein